MGKRRYKAPSPIGPTGRYPRGHLGPTDEGELTIGIAADTAHGVVVLNFGKPVAWVGLPPHVARELAQNLVTHASTVEATPAEGLPS